MVVKTFKELFVLLKSKNVLAWTCTITVIIVAIAGFAFAIPYKPYEPHTNVLGLFMKLFALSLALLHNRLPKPGLFHMMSALLIAPYGTLAVYAVWQAVDGSVELLAIAKEAAHACALIFLLPVYLTIVQDKEGSCYDKAPSDENDVEAKEDPESDEEVKEDEGEPTTADFITAAIASFMYWTLVFSGAAVSTAAIYLQVIGKDTLIHTLALTAWFSFLLMVPSLFVRPPRWVIALKFALVPALVAGVLALNAYGIFTLGNLLAGVLQHIPWIILIVMLIAELIYSKQKAKKLEQAKASEKKDSAAPPLLSKKEEEN